MTSPQRSAWSEDLLNYFSLTIMLNYYQLPAWAPSAWRLHTMAAMRLSFMKSSEIICLSKGLLRGNTLKKSTFFEIIFELLLVPSLFCLIRGCSRHWVGNLCLGFHRGIQVWSRFSLCLHKREGRGARGAAAPPNFGQLRFFGQREKIWAKPVFKDVSMLFNYFKDLNINLK